MTLELDVPNQVPHAGWSVMVELAVLDANGEPAGSHYLVIEDGMARLDDRKGDVDGTVFAPESVLQALLDSRLLLVDLLQLGGRFEMSPVIAGFLVGFLSIANGADR